MEHIGTSNCGYGSVAIKGKLTSDGSIGSSGNFVDKGSQTSFKARKGMTQPSRVERARSE